MTFMETGVRLPAEPLFSPTTISSVSVSTLAITTFDSTPIPTATIVESISSIAPTATTTATSTSNATADPLSLTQILAATLVPIISLNLIAAFYLWTRHRRRHSKGPLWSWAGKSRAQSLGSAVEIDGKEQADRKTYEINSYERFELETTERAQELEDKHASGFPSRFFKRSRAVFSGHTTRHSRRELEMEEKPQELPTHHSRPSTNVFSSRSSRQFRESVGRTQSQPRGNVPDPPEAVEPSQAVNRTEALSEASETSDVTETSNTKDLK